MALLGIPIIKPKYKFALNILKQDLTELARRLIVYIYNLNNEKLPEKLKIFPVEHHLAHIASSYYFSGFGNSAGIVVDGIGEFESTTVWKIKNGEFEKIISIPASYGSIGIFYEEASSKVGYEALEGPGKLMGLAPYGERSKYYEKFKNFFKTNTDIGKGLPFYFSPDGKIYFIKKKDQEIRKIYRDIFDQVTDRIKWERNGKLNKNASNFAWAVQKVAEEAILALANYTKEETGENRLIMAGGVALNAKANMEIYYSKLFNDMFIFPAANDAGSVIGAAAYAYEHILGGKMIRSRLKSIYLGPEYIDDEIKSILISSKFKYEYIGDDVNAVSELVSKGKIVAWYQGRAELGPRALGNRSIIANPTLKDTWLTVNKIKGREWWRPLAPSLLSESKGDYFIDPTDHEFMILMFKFNEGLKERVPAVYHVDGTARPQTVNQEQNRTWYQMIKAFGEETGENLVVNTSFNLAGEPLVETPKDALRSFAVGGFDALYMQGYLIKK